jgi:Tol biopolymer transport system component
LAFATDGDIYVINADGTGAQPLVQTPAYEGHPAWSPDGTRLAFVTYRADAGASRPNEEIYVGEVVSAHAPDETSPPHLQPLVLSKLINLTQNPAQDRAPTWSPDGGRIAFASDRERHWGIFTVNVPPMEKSAEPALNGYLDKREVQILATDIAVDVSEIPALRLSYNYRYYDAHPSWSPDGKSIAYTSDAGHRWIISLTRANYMDSEPLPGVGEMKNTMQPAWSPDGSRLAFVSNRDGNWEIYVTAADGTGTMRLTHHAAHDLQPAWSPDGQWIAYTSNRGHNWDLYLIKADGTALVRLTENPTVETAPTWRP